MSDPVTRIVETSVVSEVTVVDGEVTVVVLDEGPIGPTGPTGPVGPPGPAGIEVDAVPPSDTSILWADTSEPGDAVVPVGGASGQVLAKASATDYDTGWAPSPFTFIHGTLLGPRSDAGYGLIAGGSTVTPGAKVYVTMPFAASVDAELTAVTIESTSTTASATLVVGLYACDPITLAPTTLIATLGTVGLDSTGLKTISSLSESMPKNVFVRVAVTNGATAGTFRGISTGTTGLVIGTQQWVALAALNAVGHDNNTRAQGYAYTPASVGVFDSSPTWSIGHTFLTVPNVGLTVEPV